MAYEYKKEEYGDLTQIDIIEELNRQGKDNWEVVDFTEKAETIVGESGKYPTTYISKTVYTYNVLYKRKTD